MWLFRGNARRQEKTPPKPKLSNISSSSSSVAAESAVSARTTKVETGRLRFYSNSITGAGKKERPPSQSENNNSYVREGSSAETDATHASVILSLPVVQRRKFGSLFQLASPVRNMRERLSLPLGHTRTHSTRTSIFDLEKDSDVTLISGGTSSFTTASSVSPPSTAVPTAAMLQQPTNYRFFLPSHLLRRLGPSPSLIDGNEAALKCYNCTTVYRMGYLDKQGLSVANRWKSRFFVLNESGLFWFVTEEEYYLKVNPRGMILFKNIIVQLSVTLSSEDSVALEMKNLPLCFAKLLVDQKRVTRVVPSSMFSLLGRKHVFEMESAQPDGSERTFLFAAPSKPELQAWLEDISKAYTYFLDYVSTMGRSPTEPHRGPLFVSPLTSDKLPRRITQDEVLDDLDMKFAALQRDYVRRKVLISWRLHVEERRRATIQERSKLPDNLFC